MTPKSCAQLAEERGEITVTISKEDALELRLLVDSLQLEISNERETLEPRQLTGIHVTGPRERELRRGVEALERLLK